MYYINYNCKSVPLRILFLNLGKILNKETFLESCSVTMMEQLCHFLIKLSIIQIKIIHADGQARSLVFDLVRIVFTETF